MKQEILSQLNHDNSTPSFVFDVDELISRSKVIKECLPQINLCYAMKANPFLTGDLKGHVDYYEVCSPGEFHICVKNAISPNKIVLSGVNKEATDIKEALEYGVCIFTVESLLQADILQQCAYSYNRKVQIILRLTSGNQFGINMEDIESIIADVGYDNLDIIGIQFYSGTQKSTKKILEELDMLSQVCEQLDSKLHKKVLLEYGPGFAVDYYKGTDPLAQLYECSNAINQLSQSRSLTLEIGRFLVADCGYYITRVMDIKENSGDRYCIVDGGINHVNYYGQVMGAKKPPVHVYRNTSSGYVAYDCNCTNNSVNICGSLCTSADVLVRNYPIDSVSIGDIFVFEKIGAYSVTEGIFLFLSRKMPRVYLYRDNTLILIKDTCESYILNCADSSI